MDTVFQITEYGPNQRMEYFMRSGGTWVRETSNGRTLEMTLMTYLLQDPFELALFFALGIDRLRWKSEVDEEISGV